jgi:riboflavin synthase
MFTGIIEGIAQVVGLEKDLENLHLTLTNPFNDSFKVDQSIAHNGVCLTVVKMVDNTYTVTAIKETLDKSNIGKLEIGSLVNIERCMKMNGRLDGHIVQGHVDTTAKVSSIEEESGSWSLSFEYGRDKEHITVEKGSITINGVSLTVCDSGINTFSVAIIPYTFEHTNFKNFKVGTTVNLEFDIIGKYVAKQILINKV